MAAGKARPTLHEEQVRAIHALQRNLPLQADPFTPIANAQRLSADDLLIHAADFLAAGHMRRYAAVLRHRVAGAGANVLVAWRVEEGQADPMGSRSAAVRAVSHCYLRQAAPKWPYNLYTMIHGRDERECRRSIEEIKAATSLQQYAELWTTAEYRKERVKLFTPDEGAWEGAVEG